MFWGLIHGLMGDQTGDQVPWRPRKQQEYQGNWRQPARWWKRMYTHRPKKRSPFVLWKIVILIQSSGYNEQPMLWYMYRYGPLFDDFWELLFRHVHDMVFFSIVALNNRRVNPITGIMQSISEHHIHNCCSKCSNIFQHSRLVYAGLISPSKNRGSQSDFGKSSYITSYNIDLSCTGILTNTDTSSSTCQWTGLREYP